MTAKNVKSASSIQRFSKLATDPLRNFRYIVEFTAVQDGTSSPSNSFLAFTGGFTQVGGLSINVASISYREGGMNTTLHQVPGQASFDPITLSRGVLHGNDEAINWMKQLFTASAGEGITGAAGKNFRCNMLISLLDHPMNGGDPGISGEEVTPRAYKMQWKVYNAWLTNLRFSDLSATDNSLMYESMTFVHEGLSVGFKN
jgi:phage tail-like protein